MEDSDRPIYLNIAAYMVGVPLALAFATLPVSPYGILISAIMILALLTGLSRLHPKIGYAEGAMAVHTMLYFLCLGLGIAFAACFIPSTMVPVTKIVPEGTPVSWAQVMFVALQQALYFGIHACTGRNRH